MKRQIRRGVYETNSSSCHALSVAKLGVTEYLHVDEYENKVVVEYGEFGWAYDEITDPETKLSYLITMLHEYCDGNIYESDEFQGISDIVAERCECDGIKVDEDSYGYVDHQSVEKIDDLMSYYGCTIEEFIFDKGVTLIIDNDNH